MFGYSIEINIQVTDSVANYEAIIGMLTIRALDFEMTLMYNDSILVVDQFETKEEKMKKYLDLMK